MCNAHVSYHASKLLGYFLIRLVFRAAAAGRCAKAPLFCTGGSVSGVALGVRIHFHCSFMTLVLFLVWLVFEVGLLSLPVLAPVLAFARDAKDSKAESVGSVEDITLHREPFVQFRVEPFTSTEQGFHNAAVRAILQDQRGLMWIGTESGLVWYDGVRFRRFQHEPTDEYSLPHNYVNVLYQSRAGTLWVGTFRGLARYVPEQQRFIVYRHSASNRTSINSDIITFITEDAEGKLWVGTDKGLNVFDPKTQAFAFVNLPADVRHHRYEYRISHIHQDRRGMLWCAMQNRGTIYQVNPSTCRYTGISIEYDRDKWVAACGAERTAIDSLWVAINGALLLIDLAQRTVIQRFVIDGRNPEAERMQEVEALHVGSTNLATTSTPDSSGSKEVVVWAATYNGVLRIIPARAVYNYLPHEPANPASLPSAHVYSIYQDRSGVVWFGDASAFGLSKYAPYKNKFRLYKSNLFSTNSLSNNYIRGIYEDSKGFLWICTQYGGLNRLDRQTNVYTVYKHLANDPTSLPNDNVWAIHEDRDGTFWIGTNNIVSGVLSLAKLHSKKPVFSTYKRPDNGKAIRFVQVLYQDRQQRLWIGTSADTSVVYCLSADRKRCTAFTQQNTNVSTLLDVQSIMQDTQGRMWFAGVYGLVRFDESSPTKAWRTYRRSPTNPKSLSEDFTTCVMQTRKGEIWVATKGGGLCRYNPAMDDFTRITTREGLPHNNCYGILEDEQGYLWVSTDDGLCRFSPESGQFLRFGVGDGLQGKEFNRRAFYRSARGELFFGGTNGLNSFFPSETLTNPTVPKVIIPYYTAAGAEHVLLDGQLIELEHDQNSITLFVAALEFTAPERNLYRWTLEGLDKHWSQPVHQTEITYNNLAPGKYTLRVQGATSNGVWNENGATLTIIVRPAWWQTWWFRFIAVVLGVAMVAAVVKVRVRAVEQRNKHLEMVVAKRTHELRNANEQLQQANEELTAANEQIQQQMSIQQQQAAELERINKQLDRFNEELVKNNQRLRELNAEKNEFLGIAAHDLKNPLSGIMGMAGMLEMDASTLTPAQIETFANAIVQSSERMLDLIKNLLDVNTIEQGGVVIHCAYHDIVPILRQLIEEYTFKAESKGIALHFMLPAGEALHHTSIEQSHDSLLRAWTDIMAATQVLDNVISNAVKYSPRGKTIWVRAFLAGTDTAKVVRVEIQDEGPGMSEEDKQKLFGKFARLSARPTGGEHSTGLGLSIAHKLMMAINGKIWCESYRDAGQPGATFVLEFPCEPMDATPTPSSVHSSSASNHDSSPAAVDTNSSAQGATMILSDE